MVGQLGDEQDGRRPGGRRPVGARARAAIAAGAASVARQPSSGACGSQSKVSIAPASSTVRDARRQEVEQRVEQRRLAGPARAAATISGTRPSRSTHSVAASSASSVPARTSSTMERGVGGTGRKAHPARWAWRRPRRSPRCLTGFRLGLAAYDRPPGASNGAAGR